MKRTAIFCALVLVLTLLAGCNVTSPRDEEFLEDWANSVDEAAEDSAQDWEDAWDAWSGSRSREDSGEKDYYWKVLDGEGREAGSIMDKEQIKALDDLLSDDGSWNRLEMEEDPGEPSYSYVYCQEKTLLAGQDPEEEREYEELIRFTVSADKDLVTMRILEDLPSLAGVDLGDYLTFTISVPAETAEALRDPSRFGA